MKDNSDREKRKKNQSTATEFSREILIPPDLPTIELNYEISNYLTLKNLKENVYEEPKSKNVDINIFSIRDTVMSQLRSLKFTYSDSIRRKTAEVCLVIDSLDSYGLNDAENILGNTQEFSVFLSPGNDKAEYQSKIIELKRDYLLKFSVGDEDDVDADFKSDMKESLWMSKIKSISLNFPQVSGIILYNKKNISDFNKKITEEMIKNNLKVYPDTVFTDQRRGEDKVNMLFEDIISKTKDGKKFLFYDINMSPSDFSSYDKQVYVLKKLGYKFSNFRELMKKMNDVYEKTAKEKSKI